MKKFGIIGLVVCICLLTGCELLDDIFDKLDASRVEQIIKLVSENGFGQIFITDTNRKYLDEILLAMNHDYALFRVERGEVQPMEE